MSIENKFIGMCCVCNKIRISKDPEVWIDKNDERYQDILKESKISHTYCRLCGTKIAKQYGITL